MDTEQQKDTLRFIQDLARRIDQTAASGQRSLSRGKNATDALLLIDTRLTEMKTYVESALAELGE